VVPRFTGKPGYPAIANAGPLQSLEEALISFPFGLACLATFGKVTQQTLTASLSRPDVADLAQRVDLKGVDVPYPLWCRIEVTDRTGNLVVGTSDEIDWRHFYLDEKTAVDKFLGAADRLQPAAASGFVESVLKLESHASIREPMAILRSRRP
jgi:2-methylcitrate dehydratase PrpD